MASNKSTAHKRLDREQRNKQAAVLLLLPAIIFLLALIAYPLCKVLFDSVHFTHLVNREVAGFSGFANFEKVLQDPNFGKAAKNTVVWTIFSVLGEYLLGLITAVLLNQKIRGRAFFRIAIFIPWLVPIIVAGMTWDWILNPNFGILNYLLKEMGVITQSINFLGEQSTAMATVIFVNIWRSFPYYTISLLAALQSIPADIQEAAAIDGAGMFQRFFKITLPQLSSVSLVLTFIHVIWTSINFDFIWVMTEGGPNYSTETLPLMIYRYAMRKYDVGAASALSTMMILVMTVLFIFYYRARTRLTPDGNAKGGAK